MKLVKTLIMILLVFALGLVLWVRLGAAPKPAEADLRPTQSPAASAEVTEAPGSETPTGTEPAASEAPVDIDAEPEYFTVSMVGDCTLSASPDKRDWGIGFQRTVGDDTDYPFANTVQFLNDDYLTIANLECSLSDKKYSSIEQFSFLGKADYAKILSSGSVEFVTLANNHTMDFGQGAYNDTTAALDAVGVSYAGENECYLYQSEGGLKIGLFCMYNGLTGNAFSLLSASAQEKLVAESKDWIDRAVPKLEEMGAEYTIACLHMGTEGNYETTDVQVELCRYAIDAGFGSVYCTHAHRLQPAELYGEGIIFYGLGNWIFGGHTNPGNGKDPASYDTGIGKITLCRRGSKVTLDSYSFIPCCISSALDPENGVPGVNSQNNYQPTPYVEGGKAWQRAMSIISGTYEGANYTVGNYWDILRDMGG
ncbi:MAG: CapA family protein [Oscillospiraceae bacterium]|nr:CapA family protein [Oscillospiraceae bacterium]